MRPFIASILTFVAAVSYANAEDRLDELFASWQKAQRNLKSLVVEFTMEIEDPIYNQSQQARGSLRLLRNEQGDLFATYQVTEPDQQEPGIGLLHRESVYILRSDLKVAFRFEPKEGLLTFLTEFWPCVSLLDRKFAENRNDLSVAKQDEWYTYLSIEAKPGRRSISQPRCRVVLANQELSAIPKDMPRQLWFDRPNGSTATFNIQGWRINPEDAPKPEEFERPENRAGWQVHRFNGWLPESPAEASRERE